ncbi:MULTISPECIES: P22 phage major capsid protein family protein [unclassified Crossiella]|uniref:P22 phage major capsid protein family protein n=1 Tax=unclassified Crossiella TaxID=2620835 RepID=UPI001FFEE646|nr:MULTISPECIES: P22 phage major capsid protein family protein [unclassified Crossiella]MCK2239394.1 hypothetical protein [Crossiella sp. S99.2]MCK2252089.1 hypothetical protein [Crossiella sp. S99.1]
MPNVLLTPKQIASASLAALEQQTVLAATTWRDAEADFAGKRGDTVTVRTGTVVGPARRYNRAENKPIVIDDVVEHAVDVKLSDYLYKGVAVTDEQLSLHIADFTTRVAVPQAKSVATEVEVMVAAQMNALTGSLTFKPDGSDVHRQILAARTRLNKAGVPREDRFLAVSAEIEAVILDDPNKRLINADSDTWTAALREAVIGRLYGFNVVPSVYIADGSAVAYHRTGFPLVTRAMEVPSGASFGESMTYNDIALRLIRDYDPGYQQDRSVVSTLAGTTTTLDEGVLKRSLRLTTAAA